MIGQMGDEWGRRVGLYFLESGRLPGSSVQWFPSYVTVSSARLKRLHKRGGLSSEGGGYSFGSL